MIRHIFIQWTLFSFFAWVVNSVITVFWLPAAPLDQIPNVSVEVLRAIIHSMVSGCAQAWVLRAHFKNPWQWLTLTLVGGVLSSLVGIARIYPVLAVLLSSGIIAALQAPFFVLRLGKIGWAWLPLRVLIAFVSWWLFVPLYEAYQSAILSHLLTLLVAAVGQAAVVAWLRGRGSATSG